MMSPILLSVIALCMHDGAAEVDPSLKQHWIFHPTHHDGAIVAEVGGRMKGSLGQGVDVVSGSHGACLVLDGSGIVAIEGGHDEERAHMPLGAMTVSAWVSVHSTQEWGGLIGLIQDNGSAEEGWLLGYRDDHFCFGLAGAETDDADGLLTYLSAPEAFVRDRWYHVAGVYDGHRMSLWLDGVRVAESTEQSGDIRYPARGSLVIGGYVDDNEFNPHQGSLQHIRIYDRAVAPSDMGDLVDAYPSMRNQPVPQSPLRILVGPYLQATASKAVTLMWETTRPTSGVIEYGQTSELGSTVESKQASLMHEIIVSGLQPETNYFYRVRSSDDTETVQSEILTFQTMIRPTTPVGFVVVGDTQNNPAVTTMMSTFAWSHRPHFIMHCGDLVGTGTVKREWVHEFFGSTGDLLGRFPIYPTLGNHERDAQLYYDYFSLPGEEYFYDYRWGDVHVFVLDTNKDVSPESDQYQWFVKAVAESDAQWKVVQHHQPAYSSDSNDYGDTWKGPSSWGDVRIQEHLVPLYEQFGVDVVFNGHIHVYERTWPLRAGQVDEDNGVTYVTTGGGGGHIEDFAPTRTWFTAHKYRGHHFCIVTASDKTFELRAFDQEGKIIDFFRLEKSITANGLAGDMGQ
ncbi:MAG: metallophosphoesterase [Phycisphaerales bacterium]|nr:metallophosphoesterase [Phycisphaerales bacterium]